MGSRPPPGCWVPKQGPSPRPGRRMAQEAFEAYGKSSPLPALPHLPIPPGYVPPPVSMGTEGSRHGTLSTMRRRGDYRRGATAAGEPGVRSLYHGEGREGPKGNPPPRRQPSASPRDCVVPTSFLRRACKEGETTRAPLPPPTQPRPPEGGECGQGGSEKRPPPRGQRGRVGRQRYGTVRDEPHDRARGGHAPCKPRRGDHRGCERRVERATTGAARHAPTPCRGTDAAPRACGMRATKGKRQAPPPPHTPPPPQGWGMQEGRGGQRPPLPRT